MTAFIGRNRRFWKTLCIAGLYLMIPGICAASDAGGWRPVYDTIMKWLNFFIFVFIIVKYSRQPLAGFLKGRREEIHREINRIEQKKEEIAAATEAANKALSDSTDRLGQLKQRIVDQGKQKKSRIIADAQKEATHIIAGAKRKIKGAVLQARNKIRMEMIDRATEIAMERLAREVTEHDNQALMEQFLISAGGE